MRVKRVAALAFALLLAGCLEGGRFPTPTPPAGDAGAWTFGGSWIEGFTDADIDAWCEIARAYDNECIVMESYPPQYALRFSNEPDCRAARAEVLTLSNITASECRRVQTSGDPNEPTSADVAAPPASDAAWTLHGSFLAGYDADDISRWCGFAEQVGQTCALTRSEPPQFTWTFPTFERCDEARFALQGIEAVETGRCAARPTPGVTEYDVGTFEVTWEDPAEPSRPHSMTWEVVRAWSSDGVVVVNTTTSGIEGGDFRFTLWFRPADPSGGELLHAPGAPEPGTFDFTYREAVFWSGRPITEVTSVDPASAVRVTMDAATGTLHGTFDLAFTGTCAGDGCGDREGPYETRLSGRFGA